MGKKMTKEANSKERNAAIITVDMLMAMLYPYIPANERPLAASLHQSPQGSTDCSSQER